MSGNRRWYRLADALRVLAWVWVAASLAVPHAILGQTRVGSDSQVNSYTTLSQGAPAVAYDAAGNFVVVWDSHQQEQSGKGVFGQRFSSAGAALGAEFQVNEYTFDLQFRASLAVAADGDFVVAWQSFGEQDGYDSGVFARRYSSAGAALGGEFQVNTTTSMFQGVPAVASESNGDFVVVWESEQDGNSKGVFGRRFSSAGVALAGEFQVNTYTPSEQRYPSVATGPDGGFVVSWESYEQDLSRFGVFVQRFSSAGDPLGGEIQVNTYTVDNQSSAVVAVRADGSFVVSWASDLQDGSGYGVFARLFSSAGDAVNGEIQVNAYTEGGSSQPSLAVTSDGEFIIAWSAYGEINGYGVFARRFSSAGSPVTDGFQVNSYTDYSDEPAIAIDGAGNFVVAWSSYGHDGESFGVFAQRFGETSEVELDIDGDGQTEALTDGLLALRRFFGFTGTTLTGGAVDTVNCTRCDAAAIEPYIAGLGLALDIDGDTQVEALTDGLLVLRYLFGFTGATLTVGVVDTVNCTRCDAAAIEPYLLGLVS